MNKQKRLLYKTDMNWVTSPYIYGTREESVYIGGFIYLERIV